MQDAAGGTGEPLDWWQSAGLSFAPAALTFGVAAAHQSPSRSMRRMVAVGSSSAIISRAASRERARTRTGPVVVWTVKGCMVVMGWGPLPAPVKRSGPHCVNGHGKVFVTAAGFIHCSIKAIVEDFFGDHPADEDQEVVGGEGGELGGEGLHVCRWVLGAPPPPMPIQ